MSVFHYIKLGLTKEFLEGKISYSKFVELSTKFRKDNILGDM